MPKRTKYRRPHILKYEGHAKGGTEVSFGEFGLQATEVDGFQINKSNLHVYVSQDIQDVVDKFGLESSHNYVKQKDLSVFVWDLVKVLQITG